MFCPLCEAEFDGVIARCPNCGATLVATKDEAERAGPRSALWQGDHPDFNARLVEKLTEAQITHLAVKRTERIRYQWPLAGPLFQVYVLNSDLDQAKEVLRTVSGEFVVDDSAAIGIIGAIGIENTGAPQASGEWRDEDQSVEVWSGDDTALPTSCGNRCGQMKSIFARSPIRGSSKGWKFTRPISLARAKSFAK